MASFSVQMVPSSTSPACWTARPDSLWLWTNPSFSCPTWANLPASTEPYYSRSFNGFGEHSAMFLPPPPPNPVSARTASRRLILRRSLLDLVDAHYCMDFTDRDLLHWYLALPLEDRNIILGEGGLYHFLQNHPNLELNKGYIYVKQHAQNLHRCELNDRSVRAHMSVDVDLDRSRCITKPEFWNQDPVTCSQRAASTIQGQSYWSGESSKFIKQQGTDSMKSAQRPDETGIYPMHFLRDPYSVPAGENDVIDDEKTAGKNVGTRLSFEDEQAKFQSLLTKETSVHNAEAPTNPVSVSSSSPAASCKSVKTTAEKCTFTTPCAPAFDATTNTRVVRYTSSHTQTEGLNTTEQHTMTEVHMADLDCLTEEFIKLKMLQKSKESRAKILSAGQGTKHETAEDSGHPDEDGKRHQQTQPVDERNEVWRDAALVPQEEISIDKADLSEVWYDAEDELQLPGQAAALETSPNSDVADSQNPEPVNDESSYSVLYVSNLPSNVTQSNVRQLFAKFHPTDVSISTLKSNVRVAIVIVDSAEAAEAAVRELNGHQMHNHTLHIRHLSGAGSGGHSSGPVCLSSTLQDVPKVQTSDTQSRLTEKKLIDQPLNSSIQRRNIVYILPSPKGTCVPQHFGTMDSLDALMAELMQLHPDIGRQRILDALMEVKGTHQGVLGSLPLRAIRDMISDLLTKSATVTKTG